MKPRRPRPSVFPRNGLLAARIACVAAAEGWAGPFVRAVYSANFAEDREISSPQVLHSILTALGHDADSVQERALTAANKTVLKSHTSEAIELGMFGAPTFVVGRELFWGNDRLPDAVRWATAKYRI